MEKLIYIFQTFCLLQLKKISDSKSTFSQNSSQTHLALSKKKICKYHLRIQKILDWVYKIEILSTAVVKGILNVDALCFQDFQDLEALLDSAHSQFDKKQLKALDCFSLVKLIQRLCLKVKQEAVGSLLPFEFAV